MFTNCHTHYPVHPDFEIRQEVPGSGASCFHSVGIHPWDAARFSTNEVAEVLKKNMNGYTLAIGECGLDGLKGPEGSVQASIFEEQILLSEELELPLIIHCVKMWNELSALRRKYRPTQPWVFHGFAKYGILDQVVSSGMMISLGAGITNHPKREEMVANIPDRQLLLETDDAGIEIKHVYECVAELKKISLQELNDLITANFKNTFTRWQIG